MTISDIQTLVGRQLGQTNVPPDAHFVEDLNAESMDLVGIVAAVEDTFAIVIDEEEVPGIHTTRELFALAQARTETEAPR